MYYMPVKLEGEKMKKFLVMTITVLVVSALVVGCGGINLPSPRSYVPSRLDAPATTGLLSAEFAELAPSIDGKVGELEDAWLDAFDTKLTASGEDEEFEVTAKATYDEHNVYFLFTWKDESKDLAGKMWGMKERRGEMAWGFGSRLPNEDMLTIGFESTPIKGFEDEGCNALCHSGPNYMAAMNMGELLDIWTWRAHETYLTGSACNHIVGPLGAGIDPDSNDFDTTSGLIYLPGTLYPNKLNVGSPLFIPAGPPQQIGNTEIMKPVPEDLSTLPPETKAPYYIQLEGTPDVACMASYDEDEKTWTIEMKRSLVTDNNMQVQFAHNPAEDAYYLFHLAVFDDSSGEDHIYTEKPTTLEFVGK